MNIKTYGLPAEKSSKTEYSDVENLMEEAEKLDPDNDALQISITARNAKYAKSGNHIST